MVSKCGMEAMVPDRHPIVPAFAQAAGNKEFFVSTRFTEVNHVSPQVAITTCFN
jgi:hypothetical protein